MVVRIKTKQGKRDMKKLILLISVSILFGCADADAAEPPTPAPFTFGFEPQECVGPYCPTIQQTATFGFGRTVQRSRTVTRQPLIARRAAIVQAAPVAYCEPATVSVPVTSWVDEEVEVMEWVQVPTKKTVRKAVTTYEQRAVQVAAPVYQQTSHVCQNCVSTQFAQPVAINWSCAITAAQEALASYRNCVSNVGVSSRVGFFERRRAVRMFRTGLRGG